MTSYDISGVVKTPSDVELRFASGKIYESYKFAIEYAAGEYMHHLSNIPIIRFVFDFDMDDEIVMSCLKYLHTDMLETTFYVDMIVNNHISLENVIKIIRFFTILGIYKVTYTFFNYFARVSGTCNQITFFKDGPGKHKCTNFTRGHNNLYCEECISRGFVENEEIETDYPDDKLIDLVIMHLMDYVKDFRKELPEYILSSAINIISFFSHYAGEQIEYPQLPFIPEKQIKYDHMSSWFNHIIFECGEDRLKIDKIATFSTCSNAINLIKNNEIIIPYQISLDDLSYIINTKNIVKSTPFLIKTLIYLGVHKNLIESATETLFKNIPDIKFTVFCYKELASPDNNIDIKPFQDFLLSSFTQKLLTFK